MNEKVKSHLSPKDHSNREKHKQDNLFNPDYIELDEYGIIRVGCQRCNTPLRARTWVEVNGEKVMAVKNLPAYTVIDRAGDKPNILCCPDCEPYLKNLSEEDDDRIESAQMTGFVNGMIHARKTDKEIKEFIRRRRNG